MGRRGRKQLRREVKQRKIVRNELPEYGKHEGQRAIPRILRFGPTGEGSAQRGGEEGVEVEKGADHLTQGGERKQWADKSDRTQRERFRYERLSEAGRRVIEVFRRTESIYKRA